MDIFSAAHPVLPRPGFGHNAALAHALGQHGLAQRIVDFVRPGVGQIFPLDVDFSPAQIAGQSSGVGERGGSAHVGFQQVIKLSLKSGIGLGGFVGRFQLGQGRHQRFRHKLPAVRAKFSFG
jgi:hypothetical protein